MPTYTSAMPVQTSHPSQMIYLPTGLATSQQHSQQPCPAYFITRTNGSIVPLIPVDELPYNVSLEGVGRSISPEQTFGMQFLGTFPYSGMVYRSKEDTVAMQRTISQPTTPAHHRQHSSGKQYMAPDALARQATTNVAHFTKNVDATYGVTTVSTDPVRDASSSTHRRTDSTQARPLTDPQAIIDAIVSSKSGAETAARVGLQPKSASPALAPPSGKFPDPNKKTYCTYWIRTGECDYMQQGCMYKHEMPSEKVLKELGFRSTPRWYLEKTQTIKLGGAAGERPTVGPPVKVKDWLRKASVATTETEKSEAESVESVDCSDEADEVPSKTVPAQEKKMAMILKKPSQQSEKPFEAQGKESLSLKAPTVKSTETDNLIDFETGEPSSSSAETTNTPPSSITNSPHSISLSRPSTPSSISTSSPTHKKSSEKQKVKIFVPKGESRTKHLADHVTRQQQQRLSVRRTKQQPSETHVASLEKQIQQAQKSKSAVVVGARGSGGLMDSKHAVPAAASGRMAMGLRVRKPALQFAEIPTGKKLQSKAALGEQKGEKEVKK